MQDKYRLVVTDLIIPTEDARQEIFATLLLMNVELKEWIAYKDGLCPLNIYGGFSSKYDCSN